jgi:syntaxin-binding protein 1
MHMREAIDKIMSNFKAFTEEHAVFQGYVIVCLQKKN